MGNPSDTRQRRPSTSFRAKITALSLAATTVGLAIAFMAFIFQAWVGDRVNLAERRITLGQHVVADASEALRTGRPELARQAGQILQRVSDLPSAAFFTADGKPFLHWGLIRTPPRRFASLPTADYRPGFLEIHVPVMSGERHVGELVMISGEASVDRNLRRNIAVGLGLFVVGALISGVLAHWLSGRVLAPLSRLANGMEEVRNTKDFSVRVEPASSDEFGRLAITFNELLDEIRSNDAALRGALGELTEARDSAYAANVMKSQFLANMSHEIRTPLNGVLGMAQVMAQNPMTPAQQERLGVIRQSGEALLAILNDLLDLSKIEAGKLELEEEPFDLADLALGAHAAFTSIANAKGVSFNLCISDSARGVWRGDSVRVRQILYNLISNALKFTTEGQVQVDIGRAPGGSPESLRIRVSDTGIGIAPDKLATLFDKFVQADSSTTRKFGGTGLGLSICRELAGLMGGTIEVESHEGSGARFDVLLPLIWLSPETRQAAPVPPAPLAQPTSEGPSLRVLAAEDNPTNQIVLKTILHSIGIAPVIVGDGRDAIAAWADGDFDLILMDIQMPVLDGVAATRTIRAIEAENDRPRTPIVALSANAMKHQIAVYLEAGMDAHLAKPIQLEKLYALLEDYAAKGEDGPGAVAVA